MCPLFISEGCPYNINRRSRPNDIHRRVFHNIDYRSRSTIYIEGLSTVKNKYLCLEMVLIHGLGKCEGVGEDLRLGIGHVDIQVGSRICLNVFVFPCMCT